MVCSLAYLRRLIRASCLTCVLTCLPKAPKKSLTAPPPAVRIHLLASTRDHSSDAQAYGAANKEQVSESANR